MGRGLVLERLVAVHRSVSLCNTQEMNAAVVVILLAFSISAQAALPPNTARPFYRSPQSLFSSGEANPLDLEKKKIRQFQELAFVVSKDQKQFRLTTDVVLRDVDLSFRVANARTSETALLIGVKGSQAFVVTEKSNRRAWWPMTDVQPVPDDLGLAIPLLPIQMRKTPDWKGELMQEIPARARLKLQKFEDTWVQVSPITDPLTKGWVDLGALVLKHDFATFALPAGGKWTPIRYRQGKHLVTGSGQKIDIKDVEALMTRPDLGLISDDLSDRGLSRRNFVLVNSWEYINWAVSKLPGHGDVYWKSQSVESAVSAKKKEDIYNFDEILKRPVFSVAFDPKNPRQGLISAEGIFVTEDGLTWKKLPQFRNDNLPVAIGKNNELFVGAFRSGDNGKTFFPYLKWEQVTQIIEGKNNKTPRILRLVRIQPLAEKKIAIEVDNGIKVSKLEGSTKFGLVMQWQVR